MNPIYQHEECDEGHNIQVVFYYIFIKINKKLIKFHCVVPLDYDIIGENCFSG